MIGTDNHWEWGDYSTEADKARAPDELWEIDDDVVVFRGAPQQFEPPASPYSKRRSSACRPKDEKYDLFLSHLQRNGQDAIISMQMFLQQAQPSIKIFIDLDVDMRGDLSGTLEEGVKKCGAFIFFITDGILKSEWCMRELRWAVQYDKNIVLVRETDERHGGIEMNMFLQQVPADLLHVFKNHIAIPWYRQPAFRSVSIKSILQAAALEDNYTKDIKRLLKTKTALLDTFKGSENPTTCVEMIEQASWAMRCVFFFGGLTQFKNRTANRLYVLIFSSCFWTCGSLCCLNLIYQTVPYHVISTDTLTAYVHIPAWQSWLRWRQFVRSRGCDELLSKVSATEGTQQILNRACRIAGWLVLLVQVVMVTDVLLGFSLPATLGLGGKAGTEFGNDFPAAEQFTQWHAWVMWPLIPAVIASMFASYSMFSFVALLHILDIQNVQKTVRESMGSLSNFYKANAGLQASEVAGQPSQQNESRYSSETSMMKVLSLKASDGFDPVSGTSSRTPSAGAESIHGTGSHTDLMVEDLQAQLRKVAMEELLFKTVCELLIHLFKKTQQRMDHTCKELGSLWLHLVFFSTCQVLAISSALTGHASDLLTVDYKWWYALQDIFHLGGGVALLIAAMGVFCTVTSYFKVIRLSTMEVLIKAGCPAPRQAAVMGLLASRPLGMHVLFKTTYMDVPKAVGFFTVMSTLILNNAIQVFNGLDY
mmetsp:Transcript_11271/g.25669  ORF Transcript_11271/g.25669 Transcript_11271/m.25669 type:complete len:706 (+) Transcript_11271:148-2265(+)